MDLRSGKGRGEVEECDKNIHVATCRYRSSGDAGKDRETNNVYEVFFTAAF